MKVCNRVSNFIQLMNAEGDVRVCSWRRNNIIGNLLKQDINEILHSKEADEIRKALAKGDYSQCDADNCPYLSNNRLDEVLVDIEEIPAYPLELYLGYEGICNYNCTCCSSHQHMEDTKKNNYSKEYDLIEQKLENVLPYVKKISANGRGELFTSKRILGLLQKWKPLSPVEELEVVLETNGSLFDEKHWEQIQNLGQYHLSVAITIMSFDERVYQHLSGTKLPINKIENNLYYVKKLREQGIIDNLELATVLQEENFREMPEFTRRCIEEFGADIVRIRPIFPGGIYDENIQWFMDVRNPEHPYYEQYGQVMKHPIFQNPKVLLWSGNLPAQRRKHPGMKAEAIRKAIETILSQTDFLENLNQKLLKSGNDIYLYGIGTLGKLLLRLARGTVSIKGIYDKFSTLEGWEGTPVMKLECCHNKTGVILNTVYSQFDVIKQELFQNGFLGEVYDIYEFLNEDE